MANVTKQEVKRIVEHEYVLTLSQDEADAVKRVLGQTTGGGKNDEIYNVFCALDGAGANGGAFTATGAIRLTHPDR